MVVVLIIAILLAIAIPTFLGARERAQDRAAQSDIRNALTAEKVYYTDNQLYTSGAAGQATIKSIEPSLTYSGAGTQTAVGLATSTDNLAVCIDKKSAGGTTFAVIDVASGSGAGTFFAKEACGTTLGATAPTAVPPTSAYKTGGW